VRERRPRGRQRGRDRRRATPSAPETLEERRDLIVDAALDLLDRDGFDQLSLRRLASHVGMHAPGLYWYVESKQDLIDRMAKAILDRGLRDVAPLRPGQPWDAWMVDLACACRRALLAHRDGARVVASAFLLRTQAITAIIEMALEILETAGFERVTALGCTMTLMRYATGVALDEQASPIKDSDDPAIQHMVEEKRRDLIDPTRWPRTADALTRVFNEKFRDRDVIFRWGAQMIVRGMADLRDA
jgi:TetR/AcrR family tetracycline transcriptional repressor